MLTIEVHVIKHFRTSDKDREQSFFRHLAGQHVESRQELEVQAGQLRDRQNQ